VAHQCLPVQACLPFPVPLPGLSCPPTERCAFPPGVCVPRFDCGAGCGAGQRCVAGYCQPDACASDADCNIGYACELGQCVPRRFCGPFDRCPRAERCDAHVCVPR
jgi:hypothetical protein